MLADSGDRGASEKSTKKVLTNSSMHIICYAGRGETIRYSAEISVSEVGHSIRAIVVFCSGANNGG
jgi:hypothetical protein